MSSNDSPAWRPHTPYVSVVIPTFDEGDNVGPLARELKAALESGRPFAERLDALRMLRENPL